MEIVLLVIAVVSSCIAAVAVAYRIARPKFPVKVNCWFCNKDHKVPFGNQNCWDCPTCEQYNGFSLDGDYNKPIPAQYIDSLNHPITAENKSPGSEDRPGYYFNSVLCELCNRNQILKIRQLADFVPEMDENYDIEIEAYREYLERVYRLCKLCEISATETIGQQDDVLYRKLERIRNRQQSQECQSHDVSSASSHDSLDFSHMLCAVCAPWHVRLLRYLTFACSLMLLVATVEELLLHSPSKGLQAPQWFCVYLHTLYRRGLGFTVMSLAMNVTAVYIAGRENLSSADGLSGLIWLVLLVLHSSFQTTLGRSIDTTDVYMLQLVFATFNIVFALWCAFMPRYITTSQRRITKRSFRDGNLSGMSSSEDPPSPTSSLRHSNTSNTQLEQNYPANSANLMLDPPQQMNHFSSQNGNNNNFGDALETLSVGSASRCNTRHIKAFGRFGDTHKFTSSPIVPVVDPLLGLRQRKPVLSPARFKPNVSNPFLQRPSKSQGGMFPAGQGLFQPSSSTGHNTGWTSLGNLNAHSGISRMYDLPNTQRHGYDMTDDRASLFSEPRLATAVPTESSKSSISGHSQQQSSVHLPHTTFTEPDEPVRALGSRVAAIKTCLKRVAVILNCTAIAGFIMFVCSHYHTILNFVTLPYNTAGLGKDTDFHSVPAAED